MESDIFRAGVRPGSPGSEDEVKIMLCYTLSNIERPIGFDQLFDALSAHELVNYFELAQTLDKLAQTGHITAEGGPPAKYTATALGAATGKELEKSLPLTVREKAVSACRLLQGRERRLGEVRINKTPCEGGFILELALPDEATAPDGLGGELLCVRVFAATQQDCERLSRRFLNAPLTVYKGIVALLSADEQVLGEIFTREPPLF